MRQFFFSIATLLFSTATCYLAENPGPIRQDSIQHVKYHVLWKLQQLPEDKPRIQKYEISIDRRLDAGDFQELVCRFIKEEKPEHSKMLQLNFSYRLDEFIPAVGHPGLGKKHWEHFLGSYTWNQFWAQEKGGGTIYIVRDKSGKELAKPLSFSFDHVRVCKD